MNAYRIGLGLVWLAGSTSVALAQDPGPSSTAETDVGATALPLLPVDACEVAAFRFDSLPVTLFENTSTATDDVNLDDTGSCEGGGTQFFGTGTGPDHVYGVRVDQTCDLQIELSAMGSTDLALYLVTLCSDVAGSCVGVNDETGAGGLEELSFSATAGTDYFLVVDGNQGSAGPYELTIQETSATGCKLVGDTECGNGMVEQGEECDDGNLADGDGCSAECTSEGTPDAGVGDPDGGMDMPDAGPVADAGPVDEDAGPMDGDGGPGGMDAGPTGPGDGNSGGCCQASTPLESVPPLMLIALGWLWMRRRARRAAGHRRSALSTPRA